MLELAPWLLTIAVSFGVGTISAIFGVGGGFILVPVLSSVLGIPMNLAVGSTVCYVLGPATTALLYRKTRWIDWRLPLILTGGLFLGVILGGATLGALSPESSDRVVLITYFVILTSLGLFSLYETEREAYNHPVHTGWFATIPIPPNVELSEWNDRKISITLMVWFGVSVGFLSGFLGISGGLLVVPGLIYLFGLPVQQTVISSMIMVWIISFQSTTVHAWMGNIDLTLVTAMLAGGTLGARIGSVIGLKLGSQTLRRNFGLLALFTAIFVGIRLLRLIN